MAEARRALEILKGLGLLVESDGTLIATESQRGHVPEISRLAVLNYYRGIMERAAEAIDQDPGTERHLISVTVGVPDSLLPTLKAEANAFLERMMHLCDSTTEDTNGIMSDEPRNLPPDRLPRGAEAMIRATAVLACVLGACPGPCGRDLRGQPGHDRSDRR